MLCPYCKANNSYEKKESIAGNLEVTVITYTICKECRREIKQHKDVIKSKPPKDPKSDRSW